MKTFDITTPVDELTFDELDAQELQLVKMAQDATRRAYVPYSHFHVGAAIALDNGEVVTGANQENAAYPSGTCAERTAAYYAHATYPDAKFDCIAIAAHPEGELPDENPISPCGACRQALLQYELLAGRGVKVLLAGRDKVYRCPSIGSLLPFGFTEF